MTTNHIPVATLLERARFKGELDDSALSHLGSCDLCRNQLSWMEVATKLDLQDPPQSVMDKVLQIGRNQSRLRQLRNVIMTMLTFDSFRDMAPVGIRSSETASRQMTFEGGGVEVGIWLRPSDDKTLTLLGQVSDKSSGPIEDSSAYVELVLDGDHVKTSPVSEWGEFAFTDVPEARYALQVYLLNRVFQTPSLPAAGEQ
jgi:hypothetical protein